jgi:hypothetical protein
MSGNNRVVRLSRVCLLAHLSMNVGTKSILFGVHAFWWHPFTVALAWRRLYGKWPGRYEWCAIFCHDLGYWGCPNMDGKEGRQHPLKSAAIAFQVAKWVSRFYWWNVWKRCPQGCAESVGLDTAFKVRHHSREMVKKDNEIFTTNFQPSRLCWADKFCCFYDPTWFYLLRAHLSGEIYEFRANAAGHIPDTFSFADWYRWYRLKILWLPEIQSLLARSRRSCIFPF